MCVCVCSSLCSFVFEGFFWGFSFFNNYYNYFIFGVCGLGFWGVLFLFGAVWFWVFRCASVGGGVFGGGFVCLFVCLLVGWFVVVGTGNWLLLLLSLLLLLLAKKKRRKTKLGAACVVVVLLTEVWQFVRARACLLACGCVCFFVFLWHIMLAPVCEVVAVQ